MQKKIVSFLLAAGLLGFILSTQAAKPTVHLATTRWVPYVLKNKRYHGYAYEIVSAAFKAEGYNVDIKFMPWHQAIAKVKKAKVDGIFPEYYSQQASHNVTFSHPFSGGPIVLFKRRDNPFTLPVQLVRTDQKALFDQMKHYKFGTVYGYSNTPAFDNNHNLIKRFVSNDLANLKQLYRGIVDFIIIDKFTADYLIANPLGYRYAKRLTALEPALGVKKLFVGFAKHNPKPAPLAKIFNRGLTKIKRNGTLTKILDKDAKFTGDLLA